MNPGSRTLSIAFAAALMLSLSASNAIGEGPVLVTELPSLDKSIQLMRAASKAKDLDGLTNSMHLMTGRFRELTSTSVNALGELSEKLSLADKILSGAPIHLDPVIRKIKDDTARLRAGKITEAPVFGNPLQGISDDYFDLKSADPELRKPALEKVLKQGDAYREQYEKALSVVRTRRDQANHNINRNEMAVDKGRALERVWSEVADSFAGDVINTYSRTHTSQFIQIDIQESLIPALIARKKAVEFIRDQYEAKLKNMEMVLSKYDLFRDWVDFYQRQDSERIKEKNVSPFTPGANSIAGDQFLKNATAQQRLKDSIALLPEGALEINVIRNTVAGNIQAALSQSRELRRSAYLKDSKNAALSEFQAIIGLTAGFVSLGAASGDNATDNNSAPSASPYNSNDQMLLDFLNGIYNHPSVPIPPRPEGLQQGELWPDLRLDNLR